MIKANTLFPNQDFKITATSQDSDKLRGGYYTPKKIADFLSKWSVRGNENRILEPSCGDGQFLGSLVAEHGNNVEITAVEIVKKEAVKASKKGNKKTRIIVSDVFKWYEENLPDGKFDVVIGNPPFIRYQNFPDEYRSKAFELMRKEGLSPTKLTNSWVPFVALATRALKKGGRLALVLPAELLQVNYAKEIRRYLSTKYKNLVIVTFKFLVFPNIQQEVILILGERGDNKKSSISLLEYESLDDLEHSELAAKIEQHRILDINHDGEKWTQFYLTSEELDLIRLIESSGKFLRFGDVAEVDVGVVTGNNNFFILDHKKALELDVLKYCFPIVGRSNHLHGILFNNSDYESRLSQGERMYLFNPGLLTKEQLTSAAVDYIQFGEDSGVVDGYKCKIRQPYWWNVPSTWTPDAFLLRQIHNAPKLTANLTKAISTDTVHRVRLKDGISSNLLAIAFFNSLTFALSEIRGRSYGGGLL